MAVGEGEMSEDKDSDPMGDRDPLVLEALNDLFSALNPDTPRAEQVKAIDNLIQARIVLALEALTRAAMKS